MKQISFVNLSYLVSLGVHLLILALFFLTVYKPRPVIRSFQTSVFFESSSQRKQPANIDKSPIHPDSPLDNIPLSRKHGRNLTIRKLKRNVTAVKKTDTPHLREYITPPKTKLPKPDNQSGYLRANKRTETPTLPLLAKKPDLDKMMEGNLEDPDLSGSPVKPGEKGEAPVDSPFVPSPSLSGKPGIDSEPKSVAAASIWQRKSELLIYRNALARLVTANWRVPQTSVRKFKILIEAQIGPGGNLLSIRLLESSGLPVLDAAAERAIRVSTPFPEFPESFDKALKSYRAVFRFTPDKVAN